MTVVETTPHGPASALMPLLGTTSAFFALMAVGFTMGGAFIMTMM